MEQLSVEKKAEIYDGLMEIIATMNKTALEMGLHLTADPLEIPRLPSLNTFKEK